MDFNMSAAIFKALADANRLKVLHLLTNPPPNACVSAGSVCVCDLTEQLELAQPTVSHHMRLLVQAELVTASKRGKWTDYRINYAGLQKATLLLEENFMTRNNNIRPHIEVFDPALCCSTGVCGSEVDQALVTFAADAAWASTQGAQLQRRNLAQEPVAFAQNAVVSALLKVAGEKALPIVLLNGELAVSGRYPSRAELTDWLGGTELASLPELNVSNCCDPDSGCC